MNVRAYLIGCMVFMWCLSGVAQGSYSVIDKRAIKSYEEGEQFLSRRQWPEAAQSYQAAYQRSSDFFEAYLRHSQVLLTQRNMDEALNVALRGEARIKTQPAQTFKGQFGWLVTQILLDMGKFREAMDRFEQTTPFLDESFFDGEQVKERKRQFDFIAEHIKNPLDIEKEKLADPLNSFKLQYFPVLTADSKKLLFTKRDGLNNYDDEDIFVSYYNREGWSDPEPISPSFNTRYNEGTCTISADGNVLIFTSCDMPDSFGNCDLYISHKVEDTWQRAVNMGKNVNSRFWDSQPSLSADGRVLFFSSNRRGGYGGNDIWYTERKEDGSWEMAKNLGPEVNTEKDEVSPFIFFNNQVLFFSSDGHMGFGGRDLFMSKYGPEGFGAPRNLGYPINDQNDQVALFITAQKDYAYYTENSFHEGKQDRSFLYRFSFPEDIYIGDGVIVTEGVVLDGTSGKPIAASLSLVDLQNDSTMYQFRSDGETGNFVMLYPDKGNSGLYVEKEGYIPKIFNVEKDSLKNRDNIHIALERIESGKNFIFENVFFDFDKADLKEASVSSLRRLFGFLQSNPKLEILVEGHTDNVGSVAYNENLSLKRAESVKNYLVQLGIGSGRIEVLGRGDKSPIAPNDSEENMALNRRIEVIIR